MESKKLYAVKCKDCKEEFDEVYLTYTDFQKFLEETKCPECGGQLIQPVGFGAGRFRGRGFTKRGC